MDDALLRPGRLEVQIEIGLPKEKGRTQILHIHTKKVFNYYKLCFDSPDISVQMVAHKKLGSDVDIGELAGITKNFSGAELEGLVRWESSFIKFVRSKLDVMTMDDVVFLKEAGGKKSIPSFRAAQSCALNRLVKADSKVEYFLGN